MKRMMLFIAGILIHINLFAQPPLSGDYTIGGSSPDFAGFPDAITAVHNNGISGPVNFHIRPGVYEPENAGEAVISILDTIAGVGSTNRITFQPDASSGGTVDNVILQTPQATTALNEGSIIEIRSDYITIQQLTLQNADTTSGSKISPLIWVTVAQGANDVSGISVIECKLFGASTASRARSGFGCGTTSYNFVLQDNLVTEVHDGITFPTQSATTHALQIVGNQLSDLQTYLNNLSAEVGTAIQIGRCNDAVVQGNEIDYGGGSSGLRAISLSSADNFLIDGNRIVSLSGGNGAGVNDNFRAIQVSNFYRPNGSGQISNNMIAGIYAQVRSGIDISNGNNIDVFHNS
ncbi:MAG: hypothetical protein GWN30_16400, partial [Gammaproteobacteria bacterium]|nr:hypothetical protein [Gammaproteobacteria bacterium]NIW96996.1 hypothetical protein [Phycisphaerae bacterium]